MTFGFFENDLFGEDSRQVREAATKKAFAISVHEARVAYMPYLKAAENQDDLQDRLGQVLADMHESGVDQPERVLERLAAEDEGDDKDEDSEDDSEGSEETPDFVDTDPSDDHDRDDEADKDESDDKERKESAKIAHEEGGYNYDDFNGNSGRTDGLANDPRWNSHPDAGEREPQQADYDAWNKKNPDLHAFEKARRKAQGAYVGKHRSNVKAAQYPVVPRHLNPAQPAGPQWQESGGEMAVHTPQGVGTTFPTSGGFLNDNPGKDFRGQTFPQPGANERVNTYNPTEDAARAEVEKGLVDPNAPGGRHRASVIPTRKPLPFVPRRIIK